MEHLVQDALNVQKLIPWVEDTEEIVDFMRKIPLDKSYLRNQLTVCHFFALRQNDVEENIDEILENETRDIIVGFPEIPYQTVKNRLKTFASMSNRKEIFLKDYLSQRKDLQDTVLQIKDLPQREERPLQSLVIRKIDNNQYEINKEQRNGDQIDNSVIRKRNGSNDSSDVNNGEVNIKIKIRKIDGSLEVQSPIKRESVPKIQMIHPSTTTHLPLNLSQGKENESTVTSAHTKAPSPVLLDQPTTSKMANPQIEADSSSETTFNLIEYLKEVTHAQTLDLIEICRKRCLPINQRPDTLLLHELINTIIGDDMNDLPLNRNQQESVAEVHYHSSELSDSPNSSDTEINENSPSIENDNETRRSEKLTTVDLTTPERRPVIQERKQNKALEDEGAVAAMREEPGPYRRWRNIADETSSEEEQEKKGEKTDEELLSDILLDLSDMEMTPPVVKPQQSETTEKKNKILVADKKLVLRLTEMFPQASPDYITEICRGKVWEEFDVIVEIILSNPDHPKRPQKPPSPHKDINPDEQYEIVKALLPDADPTYLRMQCETLEYDPTKLTEFVNEANEKKDYPTMKEYLRKQQLSAQSKQYTTDFNVNKFVELFPDPEKTFNDPNRNITLDLYKQQYIYQYFGNRFDRIQKKVIWNTLTENNFKVIPTNNLLIKYLQKHSGMRCRRKHGYTIEHVQDILLLQELAYLDHKKEIERFMEEEKKKEEAEFNHAKENQLFNTCQCCFDEEVMPKNTFSCPQGHLFCKDCVIKSCEVALGEGKTDFRCMVECEDEFTLYTLQSALPPKMFSKLAQKKQLAEIKAADLKELESCPFCDFASIPNENDKIFRCLNPECMKESCRKCQEPNHIPLSCEEIEKDEEVKTRTYIENKMTEALLRKCWKCGKSFFKEEGCNKMTCNCGAQMCYICQAPVKDYSHFNGIGGDNFHLCPLYSDTNKLNKDSVLKAASEAKAEVDATKLKVDPTADVAKHFDERKKTLPREAHIDLLQQPPFVRRFHDIRRRDRQIGDQQIFHHLFGPGQAYLRNEEQAHAHAHAHRHGHRHRQVVVHNRNRDHYHIRHILEPNQPPRIRLLRGPAEPQGQQVQQVPPIHHLVNERLNQQQNVPQARQEQQAQNPQVQNGHRPENPQPVQNGQQARNPQRAHNHHEQRIRRLQAIHALNVMRRQREQQAVHDQQAPQEQPAEFEQEPENPGGDHPDLLRALALELRRAAEMFNMPDPQVVDGHEQNAPDRDLLLLDPNYNVANN